ncbi:MAG: pitrilysin family protein [Firmicutes bacterium]|nr:pitrilysin family protein [Bacillota bacterium]
MINNCKLTNGAQLVVEDMPYLQSAAVGVYIRVGSRHEPPNLAGASHLIEHMLFKGTPTRNAREIAESLEIMGGQLNAYTGKEYTCIYARTLDEDIYTAMDIIFDMIFNSELADKDIDTERNVVIEEINTYEDTPDELIHDVFSRKFWDGHPMGNSILGTLESVTGMKRDELYAYYKEYYVPANMVVSIAGNVDHLKVKEYVEGKLDVYPGLPPADRAQKPGDYQAFIDLVPKEVEQLQICLGVPGLSYHHEDRYTLTVMNSILGGGMSSRLFQKLREELGLAYSVYAYPANYSDTGLFNIYIGTSPARVEQFCAVLYEQLEQFSHWGVTEDEIFRTRKLTKSSIALSLESVMNRMTRLGKTVLMYDQVISPEEVIARINAVTANMVQDMAQRMFRPDLFSLAAIGDKNILPLVEGEFIKWWRK